MRCCICNSVLVHYSEWLAINLPTKPPVNRHERRAVLDAIKRHRMAGFRRWYQGDGVQYLLAFVVIMAIIFGMVALTGWAVGLTI